ncbi:glycoside hydrolase family 26 protein [Paenibacillus sp. SI8]|uniref:glycoside hydrolase family 26 protein n=1 Tax=unclassified Paenibacillus TaxID=185978 RepID=UPI003466C983
MIRRFLVVILLGTSILSILLVAPFRMRENIAEGAWIGEWPNASLHNLEKYEAKTTRKMDIIHTFVNTNHNLSHFQAAIDYVHDYGSINLLTLEPIKKSGGGYNTVEIANGALDDYFHKMAYDLKNWQNGSEIWIRFMHEANGNWYSWGLGDHTENTNETYKSAYQRMVQIFRNEQAMNVKFIYNVNCENVGKGASFIGAYPGDDYVDMLSIDGYNWGESRKAGNWRTFGEVFGNSYHALKSISHKPILITELSSSENGGNKANWIKNAFQEIASNRYRQISAMIWFYENKEVDWRFDSSKLAEVSYQQEGRVLFNK